MGYCVQADLLERLSESLLGKLTDDTGAGQVDATVVARAIADADAEIDGYVGTRHQVPLSPVPDLVRKMSVELAIYHLYSRRMGVPEEWRRRYEDNIRLLRDLAAGKVSLGREDPGGSPVSEPVLYEGPERVFTRENLEDF